jgi:ubiquitin C
MICVAQQRLQRADEAMATTLRLWYPTAELRDEKTLGFYSIGEGDRLFISDQGPPAIFVITLTGKTLKCYTPLHQTVDMLKAEIQETEGVPPGTPC